MVPETIPWTYASLHPKHHFIIWIDSAIFAWLTADRPYTFTEFTDASMPPKTMLVWVSTGFCHIMPTITTEKLNFTASDSSSDERCFLQVLIVLQLTQLAGSIFQLSITLLENAYSLTFSLNLFLNSLWSFPFYHLHLAEKNNTGLISYFLLTILKVSIRSLLILRPSNRCKLNFFSLSL